MDSQAQATGSALCVRIECDNPTVRIAGDLDIANADRLANRLADAMGHTTGPVVVVDLEELSFIDASGLNTVLHAHWQATRIGVRLLLRNCPSCFERVARLTGLSHVLDIEPAGDPSRC